MQNFSSQNKHADPGFEKAWLVVGIVVVLAGVTGFLVYSYQKSQKAAEVSLFQAGAAELDSAKLDLNGDNAVDAGDFGIMLAASTGQIENPKADLNGDGRVNSQDLEIFRTNFSRAAD